MARPRNLIIKSGNTVLSLSPAKFKAFLYAKATGTALPSLGKVIGELTANVDILTEADAATLLASMTPSTEVTVAATEPVAAPVVS